MIHAQIENVQPHDLFLIRKLSIILSLKIFNIKIRMEQAYFLRLANSILKCNELKVLLSIFIFLIKNCQGKLSIP